MVVALTRVGVLGSGASNAAESLRGFDADAVVVDERGQDNLDADTDVVVALGETALLDTVAAAVDVPVLPVDAGREYGGVPREGLQQALGALANGNYETVDRPTLAVAHAGDEHRAFADVTLVTAEPAKISEFSVQAGGEDVDEVRADGVVAATPAGSHGYAAAAGGPRMRSGTDGVAVVPISPFRVERVTWVLDAPLAVTVTRDETAVSLFVDGRDRGGVPATEPVELDWGVPFPVATVPGSRGASAFGD